GSRHHRLWCSHPGCVGQRSIKVNQGQSRSVKVSQGQSRSVKVSQGRLSTGMPLIFHAEGAENSERRKEGWWPDSAALRVSPRPLRESSGGSRSIKVNQGESGWDKASQGCVILGSASPNVGGA